MYSRRILEKAFLILAGLFIVCGCQGAHWYNPDKTLKEAKLDCRECHYQAEAESLASSWQNKRDMGVTNDDITANDYRSMDELYSENLFRQCMKDKGYQLVPDDELDHGINMRLFNVVSDYYYPIAGK